MIDEAGQFLPQPLEHAALGEKHGVQRPPSFLGDLRRRAYLAVKRSEMAAFADMTTAQECFEHFTKI